MTLCAFGSIAASTVSASTWPMDSSNKLAIRRFATLRPATSTPTLGHILTSRRCTTFIAVGDQSPMNTHQLEFLWPRHTRHGRKRSRYLRHDELHTGFNFDILICDWSAPKWREIVESALAADALVGAPTTWVTENHDVRRPPSYVCNFIDRELPTQAQIDVGLRRSMAAMRRSSHCPERRISTTDKNSGLKKSSTWMTPSAKIRISGAPKGNTWPRRLSSALAVVGSRCSLDSDPMMEQHHGCHNPPTGRS